MRKTPQKTLLFQQMGQIPLKFKNTQNKNSVKIFQLLPTQCFESFSPSCFRAKHSLQDPGTAKQ
ncbi:hypothetical protein DJ030_10700 [bacterium endosymbiont of Escarpia laminata]|nr:MAG: hypothetical protein DJ030_10700 [bacterium endosymbiont of Escarpia laminata]